MDEVYQISSTEKVQQLEQELAAQLAELQAEIEDNKILEGTTSSAYSSVPIPKDVSYFRKERQVILKKALQFFTDRIAQLVESKYLHMLRWRSFCTHSSVIEQLCPLYQKQISHVIEEYNDAVQRAARLSAAGESFLTGKKDPVNVMTQEGLMIYAQWLMCHLHSLKGVHGFLQVLQHLPISHRINVADEKCPDVVQNNWVKLRSAFDKNSDIFNIDVFPCSRVLRGNESCCKDNGFTLPQHSTEI